MNEISSLPDEFYELNENNIEESLNFKYLTFLIDNQYYGVEISSVMQIIGMQHITELPESSMYSKGIINLRGSIIPVIAMRLRLQKQEIEYNDRTSIIIIDIGEKLFGIIVDGVDEVVTIFNENMKPNPNLTNTMDEGIVTGIGEVNGKTVLILQVKKIFYV